MIMAPRKQQGMTAISFIILLMIFGFIGMIAIKLFPVYLEHFKVSSALKSMASDQRSKDASDDEIKETIMKKLQIDDVKSLTKDDIQISDSRDGRTVTIEYESRVNMVGNVDAVVKFEGERVEIH
ncbi:MAG: DUF4845 domain-containing protein [Gammaproteobacteria bacterium]|nr:DUF4845 domain-containing protein [Gammaproteobacteria bacterium]